MLDTHRSATASLAMPRMRLLAGREKNSKHSDLELVERLRRGDETAFDELERDLIPRLYRFASRRLDHDRELTADVVQTTLCSTLSKLDQFHGRSRFFTWLCACCRNEIAMHFRRVGSRPREVEIAEEAEFVDPRQSRDGSPEGSALARERAKLVHEALDSLPTHYADVLSWKYFEELPVKQIAQRLVVKPKAAESLLTRARAAFQIEYKRITGAADSPLAIVADAAENPS